MRSTRRMPLLCWLVLMVAVADASAQGVRSAAGFQPSRRLFVRLFPANLRVPRPAPPPRTVLRERPANLECHGCEEATRTAHVMIDSPRLTDAWLSRHTYQANGGAFGDNAAVADFWYDAVHRRIFSRSLVLHEVDDPADLRLGRAPGRHPNEPDFRAALDGGITVGHVGFVTWSQNGFGSYFAAVQGALRDAGSGYLDLSTVTGRTGRTRTGSTYSGEDLIKHTRLHPSGQLEVGFETSPDDLPDPLLLVRGNAHVEGALTAHAITIGAGGAVPHACGVRNSRVKGKTVVAACDPGQMALGGGGTCASGDLRGSRPVQNGDVPDGWEVTCSRDAAHTVYVICCSR